MSVLQVAQSLALVRQVNRSENNKELKEKFTAIYRNITKAVECMSFNLPNNYSEVY
jgi:hypothetical protein